MMVGFSDGGREITCRLKLRDNRWPLSYTAKKFLRPSAPWLTYPTLFILNRISGIHPCAPAPFKGKYVAVAFTFERLCHPGTCFFALSGTIKYEGLFLGVFFKPPDHPGRILSDSRWNFLAAPPPVAVRAHVYDHRIRSAQQLFNLFNRNSGDLPVIVCQADNCLATNEQY